MFQDENGKTYIAVDKVFNTKGEALTVANRYFKTRKDNLEIKSGKLVGETLEIGVKGDLWVVSRKGGKR